MDGLTPEETARFARAFAPADDPTIREMEAYGETHGPTTVGRAVGNLLSVLAGVVGAETVFEFGSGYGYSAYWLAAALPSDGTVVLTDADADNLDRARGFFEAGGLADRAVFEVGDAHETVAAHDGPFDLVLIDHSMEQYPDALELVRPKVPVGGLVVTDNAMVSTSLQSSELLRLVERDSDGPEPDEVNASTRALAEHLATLRDDPAFRTAVLPLGEGIAVSLRVE